MATDKDFPVVSAPSVPIVPVVPVVPIVPSGNLVATNNKTSRIIKPVPIVPNVKITNSTPSIDQAVVASSNIITNTNNIEQLANEKKTTINIYENKGQTE